MDQYSYRVIGSAARAGVAKIGRPGAAAAAGGGGGSFTVKPVDSFFIVVFAELINMLETFLYIYLCYRYLFIEVHDGQKINI